MSTRPPSFGLISEGPTDFEVILHILAGHLDDPDVDLRRLYPKPENDDPGGWFEVIRYLSSDDLVGALEEVDYVIVQIDTDVCEEPAYGVSRRHADGRERAPLELLQAVRERLLREIQADVLERHGDQLIFAIAVDSIECWLLPAAFPNKPGKAAKTANCLAALNEALRTTARGASKAIYIDPAAKRVQYYKKALRLLDRKRTLHTMGARNPSLGAFVEALHARLQPQESA